MQRVELTLVAEELHDDDGRREGQRDRDIEAGDGIEPQAKTDEEPESGSEEHLTEARRERNGSQRLHEPPVQLQADEKEKERDPEFGEELDLLGRLLSAFEDCCRGDPDDDETDNDGLTKERSGKAYCGCGEEKGRNLVENQFVHRRPAHILLTLPHPFGLNCTGRQHDGAPQHSRAMLARVIVAAHGGFGNRRAMTLR